MGESERETGRVVEYATPRQTKLARNFFSMGAVACVLLAWVTAVTSPLGGDLVGFFEPATFFVWTALGVTFGVVGLWQSKRLGGRGKDWAWLALLLSVPCLASGGWHLWPHPGLRERENRVKCQSNLRQIGLGIEVFANDNGGRLPGTFGPLVISADLNPEVFVCPSSNDAVAKGATVQQSAQMLSMPGYCTYVYLGAGMKKPVGAGVVLAYEAVEVHEKWGAHFLFGDGQVKWMEAKEAEGMLKELKAGRNPPGKR